MVLTRQHPRTCAYSMFMGESANWSRERAEQNKLEAERYRLQASERTQRDRLILSEAPCAWKKIVSALEDSVVGHNEAYGDQPRMQARFDTVEDDFIRIMGTALKPSFAFGFPPVPSRVELDVRFYPNEALIRFYTDPPTTLNSVCFDLNSYGAVVPYDGTRALNENAVARLILGRFLDSIDKPSAT